LTRLTQLSLSSITLGLLALGGPSAAHATATQCTGESGSVLGTSLLTQFGNEGSCGGDTFKPGEEGEHNEGPPNTNWPPIWHPPQDGWHDGKYFRDGKECSPPVVPLPPSSLLLASGALALLMVGRRRRPATA
jgi:hypothetical protein